MEPKLLVVSINKKGTNKNALIRGLNIYMTNYRCSKSLTTNYYRVDVRNNMIIQHLYIKIENLLASALKMGVKMKNPKNLVGPLFYPQCPFFVKRRYTSKCAVCLASNCICREQTHEYDHFQRKLRQHTVNG